MASPFLPAVLIIGTGMLAASLPAPAHDHRRPHPRPPQPLLCAQLAGDAGGLVGSPGIKSVASIVVPPAGSNVSYCQVDVLYGTSPEQNINVRVGLPLGPLDSGAGGVIGAWNGRTQGIGGGGCSGSLNVNGPVNAGYVGSGNDTGHTGGNCEPGVNPDGTYNLQFINDFIRNGMKAAGAAVQAHRLEVLREGAGLQLLERLLHRRPPGHGGGAGTRQRARRHPGQRAGDVLDALPDRADVGPDRHEGPGGRADLSGQAGTDHGIRRGSVRRQRRRRRWRDRRAEGLHFQRQGQHLRRRPGRLPPTASTPPKPKPSTASGTARAMPRASASGSAWTAAPTCLGSTARTPSPSV